MLELGPILELFPKAGKDARRIGLFVTACQKKAIELVASPAALAQFAHESFELAMKFSPRKFSFADLFRDPYKGAREAVRVFAEKWQMDPVFIEEMG